MISSQLVLLKQCKYLENIFEPAVLLYVFSYLSTSITMSIFSKLAFFRVFSSNLLSTMTVFSMTVSSVYIFSYLLTFMTISSNLPSFRAVSSNLLSSLTVSSHLPPSMTISSNYLSFRTVSSNLQLSRDVFLDLVSTRMKCLKPCDQPSHKVWRALAALASDVPPKLNQAMACQAVRPAFN